MLQIRSLSFLALFTSLATLAGCVAGSVTDDLDAVDAVDDGATGTSASEIVGGQATSAYPAVGALTRGGSPFCTGTVVASRVVVTAAHCLDGVRATAIRFALGPNGFAPQASIPVARAVMHPQYDRRRLVNDIGVLILGANAPVSPVPLNASMDRSWIGRPLTFVGYGATNGRTGGGGGFKRVVTIAVSEVGQATFSYADRAKNTCFGDSGGPAFAVDPRGRLTLAGVTSYGDSTCSRFGVDTRVDAYRAFLAQAAAN
jgi:secreted trypsin-like serine protease